MLPELIEVLTTTAEKTDAQALASMLVEKRLAACVQVIGPIESSYWWNDRLETAREWQVVVKTRGELYAAVESAILEMHPYDEPELLALPVVAVSPGYRAWLSAQLALPEKRPAEATGGAEPSVESPPLLASPAASEATAPAAELPPPLQSPGKLDVPPKVDSPGKSTGKSPAKSKK